MAHRWKTSARFADHSGTGGAALNRGRSVFPGEPNPSPSTWRADLLGVAGCFLVLPGVAWCCMVLLGVAWCCLLLLGVASCGLVLRGVAWFCLVLPGVTWCCLVLCGVAWCCLALPGVAWRCLLLLGVAWRTRYNSPQTDNSPLKFRSGIGQLTPKVCRHNPSTHPRLFGAPRGPQGPLGSKLNKNK